MTDSYEEYLEKLGNMHINHVLHFIKSRMEENVHYLSYLKDWVKRFLECTANLS